MTSQLDDQLLRCWRMVFQQLGEEENSFTVFSNSLSPFLVLNPSSPHGRYTPPPKFEELFQVPKLVQLLKNSGEESENKTQKQIKQKNEFNQENRLLTTQIRRFKIFNEENTDSSQNKILENSNKLNSKRHFEVEGIYSERVIMTIKESKQRIEIQLYNFVPSRDENSRSQDISQICSYILQQLRLFKRSRRFKYHFSFNSINSMLLYHPSSISLISNSFEKENQFIQDYSVLVIDVNEPPTFWTRRVMSTVRWKNEWKRREDFSSSSLAEINSRYYLCLSRPDALSLSSFLSSSSFSFPFHEHTTSSLVVSLSYCSSQFLPKDSFLTTFYISFKIPENIVNHNQKRSKKQKTPQNKSSKHYLESITNQDSQQKSENHNQVTDDEDEEYNDENEDGETRLSKRVLARRNREKLNEEKVNLLIRYSFLSKIDSISSSSNYKQRNPFSILSDPCFKEFVMESETCDEIERVLEGEFKVPCCNSRTQIIHFALFDQCSDFNCEISQQYYYSFCYETFCLKKEFYHCPYCKTCNSKTMKHCFKCNECTERIRGRCEWCDTTGTFQKTDYHSSDSEDYQISDILWNDE